MFYPKIKSLGMDSHKIYNILSPTSTDDVSCNYKISTEFATLRNNFGRTYDDLKV